MGAKGLKNGGGIRAKDGGLLHAGEQGSGGVVRLAQGAGGEVQVRWPLRFREEDWDSPVPCQDPAAYASPKCPRQVVSAG